MNKKKILALFMTFSMGIMTACGAQDNAQQTMQDSAAAAMAGTDVSTLEETGTDTAETSAEGVDDTAEATPDASEGSVIDDEVAELVSEVSAREKPVQAPPTDPNIYKADGYVLVNENGQYTYPNPEDGSPEIRDITGGQFDDETSDQGYGGTEDYSSDSFDTFDTYGSGDVYGSDDTYGSGETYDSYDSYGSSDDSILYSSAGSDTTETDSADSSVEDVTSDIAE